MHGETRTTRSDSILLAKATAIKSALQVLTPLVLVRLIDQEQFGEYRLFWLIVNTATLFLALGIERSLLYFLPRSTSGERSRIVTQTLFYFLLVGIAASISILFGSLWFPESVGSLTQPPYVLAAFTFFWLLSTPINVLPNADQNIVWQSRAIIVIAVLRVLTVVVAAWISRDLHVVFLALLVWSILQFMILAYYVWTHDVFLAGRLRPEEIKGQLTYAVPFGISHILTGMRRQGEQWIVAFMFQPAMLAIFSIGLSFNLLLNLVRSSIGSVLLPKMSRLHALGDFDRALALNNRGNIAVLAVLAPIIGLLWVFAEPVIRILYTEHYLGAVPVLRVYLIAMLIMCVEFFSVMMIYDQGRFVMKINAAVLITSLFVSYFGAQAIGIAGIAIGALFGEIVSRIATYRYAVRLLGKPMSELQDWGTLARILIAALAATIAARFIDRQLVVHFNEYVGLIAGTVGLFSVYVAALLFLQLKWLIQVMAGRETWKQSEN